MKKQLLFMAFIAVAVVTLNTISARYQDESNDTNMSSDTTYNNGPVGRVVAAPFTVTGKVLGKTGEVFEDTGDVISGKNQ